MVDPAQGLIFAYPGDLETPTGGYGYDRRIIAGLRAQGWAVELLPLGDGFPFPDRETMSEAEVRLRGARGHGHLVIDGLAAGVLPDAIATVAGIRPVVALVHHPLCMENGLGADAALDMRISENRALAHASHVIVTSNATARQVAEMFSVAPTRISVIEPGTDRQDVSAKQQTGPVRLLSVGTIVPRKGYDVLFAALAKVRSLDWSLEIVGDTTRDLACFAALKIQLSDLRLSDRVTFHGAVASHDLHGYYRAADIFVLASRYEGYGMAYTEALSHGLPVIGSGDGAVRDTLPDGAAIYCGTSDAGKIEKALKIVLTDPQRRRTMAEKAARVAARLPTWADASARFAATLQHLSFGAPA